MTGSFEADAVSLDDMIRFNEAIEGTPIPQDMIPKIVDPFYRLENRDLDTQSTSVGLGLYVSKEIVAAHGGTIEVRSSVDEGTTFIVCLPNG